VRHTLVVPGLLGVIDDVVLNPLVYRRKALTLPFDSVAAGPDTFHGIAPTADPELPNILMRILPAGASPTLTFFRKSPAGQVEPNYLHTDAMMGDWTAILYLNPDPPIGDGTTFWRTVDTHQDRGADIERSSMQDLSLWERWHHIDARFNRLLVFKSDLYHSRAIAENYGQGDEARLIQVAFGQGQLWP
jgi:uncharacterized protein DUF6445